MVSTTQPKYQIIELDPDTNTKLKLYLFKNVQNVEMIRDNIIHGVWKCTGIKPGLIIDPFQVAVAANKAVLDEKRDAMVTRSVYTEILYNLSATKNISQSLLKFGIHKDMHILFCFLVTEDQDTSSEIIPKIEGEMCSMKDLSKFTSFEETKHVYKLNHLKGNERLLDLIVSKMATKAFVTH
ncbi:EKC/KEOPS complex subunit TPRKB-like [Trichoplusia ni]|uniref:EKC/KEOPS complex subunit TPRKB-like n=1 Tax=Trichoplusia ni TaxID=7111 RepID=A0A7E5X2H7_TRINI|nr:EKC/KEOPS complex subunit TPRKB-like [Trichoplusia ni]